MSQPDESWKEEENRIPKIEPLPFIDYNLIQRIISIPSSKLEMWEVDGFTSLIEGRKRYYAAHNKFQFEYNGLQDAKLCLKMLKDQKLSLKEKGEEQNAELRRKLEWTVSEIGRYKRAVKACQNDVQVRWQQRNYATAEFGRMKTEFVETMLPGFMKASEQPEVKALLESSSGL